MGFIQKILSPIFDKSDVQVNDDGTVVSNQELEDVVVEEVENSNVYIDEESGQMKIGENLIESFNFGPGATLKNFLKQDFDNGNLSFLKDGAYIAKHIKIELIEFGSDIFKIKDFVGTWKEGNLVCDYFYGNFKGGTLCGNFKNEINSEFTANPAASITGDINTTGDFNNKDVASFIRGTFKSEPSTLSRLNLYVNKPIFGVPVVGIKKIDKTTSTSSISLLSLNSGQYVTFKDNKDRVFSFEVIESYKDSGDSITLRELTHDKNLITLTWNHFRVSTTSTFNKTDFEANSSLRIGVELRIPKLFKNNIVDDLKEVLVNNEKPNLVEISKEDKESSFVPQKIKF